VVHVGMAQDQGFDLPQIKAQKLGVMKQRNAGKPRVKKDRVFLLPAPHADQQRKPVLSDECIQDNLPVPCAGRAVTRSVLSSRTST